MLITFLKIPYLKLKYRYFPNEAQEFWSQDLINSQGLTAKIGQVLGQGKKTLSPKPTLNEKTLRKMISNQFPSSLSLRIGKEVHAASMGQVFFIEIDGHEYALKILHPGIKKKLKKEISNLLLLGQYYGKIKGFHFNRDLFQRFLMTTFEEETDLIREANYQDTFFKAFKEDHRFKVPQTIKEFSNENQLCQELIRSTLVCDLEKIQDFSIFDFFFKALFNHQLLHGDLSDRNWGELPEGRIVIYDFGCTQHISGRRINGLKKLLLNQDITEAFREVGVRLEATPFKNQEQELRNFLFDPLLQQSISPEWSYSKILKDHYGDKIKALREYTDPWVLLMMRSLFSLIKTYQAKNQSIPLGEIIRPYLALKEMSLKSQNIKIEVLEDNKQVVSMALPITALDNLKDLMPQKVLDNIKDEKINLENIIERVKATQFIPQDLFSLQLERRSYRVWID